MCVCIYVHVLIVYTCNRESGEKEFKGKFKNKTGNHWDDRANFVRERERGGERGGRRERGTERKREEERDGERERERARETERERNRDEILAHYR